MEIKNGIEGMDREEDIFRDMKKRSKLRRNDKIWKKNLRKEILRVKRKWIELFKEKRSEVEDDVMKGRSKMR